MEQEQKERWPGVDAAYSFVVPSYQFMLSRYEAADNRLNALTTAAASLAGLTPVIGRAMNPSITFGTWFLVGLMLLVSAVVVGLWTRSRGGVVLPNPRRIYEKHLHESDWEFRKNAIVHAGENFDANAEMVEWKGRVSLAITVLMILGIGSFSLWLSSTRTF